MTDNKDIITELIIPVRSSYADDRFYELNYADSFGVFDRWGDINPGGQNIHGLYHEGTRFISDFRFYINNEKPLLLSSSVTEENEILNVDLTNPDIGLNNRIFIPKGNIHAFRSKFVLNNICYERIILTNYSENKQEVDISFLFSCDFKDIFEVRGAVRNNRGIIINHTAENSGKVTLTYKGLDNILRETVIKFSPKPDKVEKNKVMYKIKLKPKQSLKINNSIALKVNGTIAEPLGFTNALNQIAPQIQAAKEEIADIFTSNEQFNHWISRSKADLISLITNTNFGKYPYAGVPWFNTPFGRDGIITSFCMLWAYPVLAKDVLFYLAKTQAKEIDSFKEAEPGKIFHEARTGEMVETGEIPFKLYYGTVDATPLFIVLAGAYYKRTADIETIKKLWENILLALEWINNYGDINGDGYVEYIHKAEKGLENQGWKDSDDSISYEDGKLAKPPIALCEVQGYVYDAKKNAAFLAGIIGEKNLSEKLNTEAEILKENFNRDFWDEELNTFVLALDGDKNPCRVKSSNAGHCLFSGIVKDEYAEKLANTLLSSEMFTGWGIRTLSSSAVRYNPMSYHNGSVWPHDTALIAYGLSLYGFKEKTAKLIKGLFDATLFIDLQRLPELFCGFERRKNEGPTAYPVACSPQAWAVASVYLLLQACLRIEINPAEKKLCFNKPILPDFIDNLEIKNLSLGQSKVHIKLEKYKNNIGINVIKKDKAWEVITIN